MFVSSIVRIIKTFNKKKEEDSVNAFSAQAAYFVIISFFPFLMFLLTLLKYVPVDYDSFAVSIVETLPETISPLITTIIGEIRAGSTGTLISVTVIAALWSASKGFLAIVRGLNRVYNHKETRSYFVLRLWSMLYTIIFAVMIVALLVIFVFGNRISHFFMEKAPILSEFALLVISVRTVTGLCALVLFFLFIYVVIPNRKSSIMAELPGALVSAAGWMGYSYLYSYYIDNMGNYTATYGSLTAIVLCMLWLYFCMYIMFVGAEINAILKNQTVRLALRNLFSLKKKEGESE